ncbi:SH3 domain-containing protein [Flaviflagellibacter deserti]|jgi:hypothetical protein|uniref:SH3 domain-containing protein n=1 Tax=Flaviflagellibacter deserti TaxID=2267266 RepID=A0ABV9Z7V9_9HYPH
MIRSIYLSAFAVLITANALAEDAINPLVSDPALYEAAVALVPKGLVAGQAFRYDTETKTAYVAAFRDGADDPQDPGLDVDGGQVLELKLAENGGKLNIASHVLRPRQSADDVAPPEQWEPGAPPVGTPIPSGVIPCSINGWSNDPDPSGLNVRAAPDTRSMILGRLAPPWKGSGGADIAGDMGYRTEFRIIGYRKGWFLIQDAQEPGAPYEDPPPKRHPKSFKGRGWVKARLVGAAYANSNLSPALLRQAPHRDAALRPTLDGEPRLSIDGTLEVLEACSGQWALTRSRDGQHGWWRGICSNQVTNCS